MYGIDLKLRKEKRLKKKFKSLKISRKFYEQKANKNEILPLNQYKVQNLQIHPNSHPKLLYPRVTND